MAELDKTALLEFLAEIDKTLEKPMQLVAVCGTVLTLMDCKASTRDVDFTGPAESIRALRAAIKRLSPGFKVDSWKDGMVFMVQLPRDYLERSTVKHRFNHLELRHAHPVDLIVTKVGRFDDRDMEDIKATVKAFKVKAADIQARAALIEYVGNEMVFEDNLKHCLDLAR